VKQEGRGILDHASEHAPDLAFRFQQLVQFSVADVSIAMGCPKSVFHFVILTVGIGELAHEMCFIATLAPRFGDVGTD
jgi:hypothetical protein